MVALQAQLRRIVARKFPEVDLDVPLQQDPGTLTAMTLKKALAAGWADQVSKLHVVHLLCLFGNFWQGGRCRLKSVLYYVL